MDKILALDIATNTGWCIKHKGKLKYGNINLKSPGKKQVVDKMIKLSEFLIDSYEEYKFTKIVYERIAGRFKNSLIHEAKLVAIIELFCYYNNVKIEQVSPKAIKKFATGSGNASKKDMIEASRKYGYQGNNDNIADAIHIYHLSIKNEKS